MFRVALVLCALGGSGALVGCGGMAPPAASPLDANRANVQLADLQNGRSLLLRKCGGCHRVPLPTEHSPHDWPAKLSEMSARAHVDESQRQLIEAYLVTMAAR